MIIIIFRLVDRLTYQSQTEIFIEIKNRNERIILPWGLLPFHPKNYRIRKVRLPLGNMVLKGLKLTQNMQVKFVENGTGFEDALAESRYIGVWNATKIKRLISSNYYFGIIMTNPTRTFSKIDRLQIIENWYRVQSPWANILKNIQSPDCGNPVPVAQWVPAANNLGAAKAFPASAYFHQLYAGVGRGSWVKRQ